MTATALPPRTQDLSEGPLGIALLDIERGDLSAARRHLARAVAHGVSAGGNASLFHGAPALEFVLSCAGQPSRHVRGVVDRVVDARLATARRRQQSGALPHPAEWDLIRGLTGLAALLLTRHERSARLTGVVAYLVSLSRPIRFGDRHLPGWWSALGPGGKELAGGHGDNGMAHGIAGPLSVLSLAAQRDLLVPGHQEAIETFARWLDRYGGHYWTTLAQLDAVEPPGPELARPSWCYGTPGIARAQQLAALTLGDKDRQQAAEDTVVRTLTDPAQLIRVTDSTVCHGWAGLVALARAVAADSPAPERFTPVIDDLRQRLASGLDLLVKPGFMEGRGGARLAHHGTNTTNWTRALLIT
ncbi:lanthionine synthetase C family protein [Streptomyces sp. NPDC005012]|uniref:lanthionine synthetase C family protein n=1 Tax=Streptomyces sp. NPDC005012 TaxID=3154558 RepID=UPI0033BC1664